MSTTMTTHHQEFEETMSKERLPDLDSLQSMTFPPTPAGDFPRPSNPMVDAMSKKEKRNTLFKEVGCHSSLFAAGWSDSSNGPLLPYIQAYFGITYTVVSCLFIGQMVGFLSAGFVNGWLSQKFGLGKVIFVGAAIQAAGYILLIPAFPFPIMPICYAVVGFGLALQDAQANTYVAILPNADKRLGYLHATYGLGALVCPLAATSFASAGYKFSYFYIISLGVGIINCALLLSTFKFSYRVPEEVERTPAREEETEGTQDGSAVPAKKKKGLLMEIFTNRIVWVLAIFIVVYVGAEVSQGGWIVTFLIDEREGGPSAGYIATGFWAGIAAGRVVLPWVTSKIGGRASVYLYLALCIALEFSVWYAHSLIGNAVAVSFVGFLLGPLYPNAMNFATKLLPRHLHASAIGWIAAAGQTGSALFPFITGALAQRFSPVVLQPVLIVLMGTMCGLWFFVPPISKKHE